MSDGYPTAEGLRVAVDDAILRLTLARPAKKNALTDEMVHALAECLDRANDDDHLRVVVLTAEGQDFCVGADIVARNQESDVKRRVGSIQRRLPGLANRLIPLMTQVQVPIVCAVQGMAAGIGLHIALASDFTIVTEDSVLWEPFALRGFTPDTGATWLLPRLVGVARAREMLFLGRRVDGRTAAGWGMVHRAVPCGSLDAELTSLVDELAAGPTVTLGLTKWLVNSGLSADLPGHLADEAFAMELSSRSPDFREGMKAFMERRRPEFGGM